MKDAFLGTFPPKNIHEKLKRIAYLKHILDVYRSEDDDGYHEVPIWESWLYESGELPPDFDNLPTVAYLPDALRFQDGKKVTSHEQWERRREEIAEILKYYQLGNWPPPPAAMAAYEIRSTEDDVLKCIKKYVVLTFAPTENALEKYPWDKSHYQSASLKIDLFIPHGNGSFPAVVGTGFGAVRRDMYDLAVRRGYVVCRFDTSDAFACRNVYADYDCNELVWWAWATSRCIDYLNTLKSIDKTKIAAIGHSRGAKSTLIAAALDQRICATIASHTGSGSGMTEPWRYIGEKYGGETLEDSTRMFPYWNNPRMRFFAGRENKLPFDSNFMIALVAPRSLLITEGDRDPVGEPWGAQQAFIAAKEVYRLLKQEDRLNIAFSHGEHTLDEATMEMYIDWLDMQFSRKPRNFPDNLMYTYTFDKWKEVTGDSVDLDTFQETGLNDLLIGTQGRIITKPEEWRVKKEEIKKRIMWVLGELPQYEKPSATTLIDQRMDRNFVKAKLPIDEKLICHLTYPAIKKDKFPTVIFCHAYLDQRGFDWPPPSVADYGYFTSIGERLAQRGFVAVEFDQFGYGTRNHDCGIEFYSKHPCQSAMSVMIQDVRRIIDALSYVEIADQSKIMAAGYSIGGAVALHSAVLDERIKAVASICGFASMRMDAHNNATEGLRRYSHLRSTLPRLGFFVGHEDKVPYDYHEVLAMIAPRPVFILAPILDQDWFPEDVKKCYEEASKVYQLLSAQNNIQLYMPNDFNRYPPKYQNRVNDWLCKVSSI